MENSSEINEGEPKNEEAALKSSNTASWMKIILSLFIQKKHDAFEQDFYILFLALLPFFTDFYILIHLKLVTIHENEEFYSFEKKKKACFPQNL